MESSIFNGIDNEIIIQPPDEEILKYCGLDLKLETKIRVGKPLSEGQALYYKNFFKEYISPFPKLPSLKILGKDFLDLIKLRNDENLEKFIGSCFNFFYKIFESFLIPEYIILAAPVTGLIKKIDDLSITVLTDNQKSVNCKIEVENTAKLTEFCHRSQNAYRNSVTVKFVLTLLIFIFSLFWAEQILAFLVGGSSLISFVFDWWQRIFDEGIRIQPEKHDEGIFINSLMKTIISVFIFWLSWIIFKLPSKSFIEAISWTREIFKCPIPNKNFEKYDKVLRFIILIFTPLIMLLPILFVLFWGIQLILNFFGSHSLFSYLFDLVLNLQNLYINKGNNGDSIDANVIPLVKMTFNYGYWIAILVFTIWYIYALFRVILILSKNIYLNFRLFRNPNNKLPFLSEIFDNDD
jgi:hypothetical protein